MVNPNQPVPERDEGQSRRRKRTVIVVAEFVLIEILCTVLVVKDLWLILILSPIALLISQKFRLDEERERREKMKELVPYVGLLDGGDECPICFRDPLFRCHSSCGHSFCGSCILYYWDPNEPFTPYRCFICENQITELTPDPAIDLKEHVGVWRSVEQYNHLMVIGRNGLVQEVLAVPLILKMVYYLTKMYGFGEYHINPRILHFSIKIEVIVAALSRCYLLDLFPIVTFLSVLLTISLYNGYGAYSMSLRKRWPTHYRKWR